MVSKTISVTIPEQLEEELQKEANKVGLSRSRFICNILLDWQKHLNDPINDCKNQEDGFCGEFGISCKAPKSEAKTCPDYYED